MVSLGVRVFTHLEDCLERSMCTMISTASFVSFVWANRSNVACNVSYGYWLSYPESSMKEPCHDIPTVIYVKIIFNLCTLSVSTLSQNVVQWKLVLVHKNIVSIALTMSMGEINFWVTAWITIKGGACLVNKPCIALNIFI